MNSRNKPCTEQNDRLNTNAGSVGVASDGDRVRRAGVTVDLAIAVRTGPGAVLVACCSHTHALFISHAVAVGGKYSSCYLEDSDDMF